MCKYFQKNSFNVLWFSESFGAQYESNLKCTFAGDTRNIFQPFIFWISWQDFLSNPTCSSQFLKTAQTANRILEEECLVASFFWLISGRTKCASPLTISQKWNFKEFAGIQQPTVHSSVIWYSFKSGSQFYTKNSPALIFLLCKHWLRTHTFGMKLQFSYLPHQCLTG